jgi:hypothetical protein
VIRVVRKWHNLELDSLSFDEDPNELTGLELVDVKPAEATIIMPLDDEQKQMWKFYLKPGSPAQDIDITFPTWVPMTSHVRLNIDYHLSPGAGVNIFANGFFLGQFTGPPMMKLLSEVEDEDTDQLPETNKYTLEFDPNSLGFADSEVDFVLQFFGPLDRVLYLDNLVIENLEAWYAAADIDGSGGVDFADFSILASVWRQENCGFPNFCEGADINYDGVVGIEDLQRLTENWLEGVEVP